MTGLAWMLVSVPLGGGALLCLSARRRGRGMAVLAITVAGVTLGLAILAAATRPAASAPLLVGIQVGLAVDGLSAVIAVSTAAVTLAVLLFTVVQAPVARMHGTARTLETEAASEGQPDEAGLADGRFFGLMLLFAAAMLVTVVATTLPVLLMGWEAMGATSWALIGFWWREPERVRAANTAFLTTRAADLGLYLAAGAALAGGTTTLRLADLPHTAPTWRTVTTVGIVLAALGKSAQLPFSFWLSAAMHGPSPVSALLHSATMVAAGAYLLLRLHPLLAAAGWAGPLLAWAGATTALLLGLVALAQRDLKQLLAASTCAQIGFIVLAAGAGAVTAGTGQWMAHAATKSLLFLIVGGWLTALGTQQLSGLRGAARRYPSVGVPFTVGILTLAGLAPLSLWVTKDAVLAAAWDISPWLYAVGLAAAVVSAAYSITAAWYVLRPAGAPAAVSGARRIPRRGLIALVPLTVAAAGLGVLALPGPAEVMRRLLDNTGEPDAVAWQMVASAAAVLLTAAATWRQGPYALCRLPAWVRGWLVRWLDLHRVASKVLVRPTLAVARALAGFDDRVIDAAVRRVARGGLGLARLARQLDDGGIDGLVAALAAGVRGLGRLARRPQTGLLHQYYLQITLVLAALIVMLLATR